MYGAVCCVCPSCGSVGVETNNSNVQAGKASKQTPVYFAVSGDPSGANPGA